MGAHLISRAVAVFYLAVVLEKGQIVDCSLDPENEPELVVQLDRNRPHGVFDSRSFDTYVETISHLAWYCVRSLRPRKVVMLSAWTV
jgi:hypothetical protein